MLDLEKSLHDFQFSRKWFLRRNRATFEEYVYPEWRGRRASYLEIGVFEGMSLAWMMTHVLMHPKSFAVGVDPHLMTTKLSSDEMAAVRQRALHNTKPWRDRCNVIQANSAEVLRRMCGRGYAGISKETLDLCMIDGNHNAPAVLDDARHVLKRLRPGGWMIFDDYENDRPKENHVKEGVTAFLDEEGSSVELVFQHKYVIAFKKVE